MITLPVVDLRGLPEAEREHEVQRLVVEEARRPFDLARGPLLRARVLQLADDEQVGLLTMHHIVSDGWSAGILIREMAALYQSYCTESPSPLPELPIQYADFAYWQREWLQGAVLQRQLDYWKKQLDGCSAVAGTARGPSQAGGADFSRRSSVIAVAESRRDCAEST